MANRLACIAETALQKGNMKDGYASAKKLCNSKPRKMGMIKDKNGKVITMKRERP